MFLLIRFKDINNLFWKLSNFSRNNILYKAKTPKGDHNFHQETNKNFQKECPKP